MELLHEVLAAQPPNAPALSTPREGFRYGDLQRRAERAAALLWHGWGVRPGDRVAWLGANDARELVLLFALARIGAILLPLNVRLAQVEWRRLLADAQPARLVHDEAFAESARALAQGGRLQAHGASELEGSGHADAPLAAAGDAPVLLVYTSGTTGGPKGALHTQANLLANMRIAAQVQGMTDCDTVMTVLPLFHVGGLCIQTLPALHAGARVILHARFDAGETLAAIASERPTLTLQVPATMKAMIEHPAWHTTDLSSLRAVWAGSSVLPQPLVEAFHARGVPVCNVYGATETGPFSIALPPEHAFDHGGSCGWPAPEVEAKLVNGEVWLRAPNIVRRYWPDQPACDADGWFHTGDLATQAADASYTIVGRAKELIISGGENIHPMEIESALMQHPAVLECAAFGVKDAQWGEAVAIAVVCKPGVRADEAALREHLAQRIARYKLPRHWYWLEALPKTALGKVQRSRLAAGVAGSRPV